MTVLQLVAINLILISLIVCQTLSYDVDSFFFIILPGHQTLLYVYDKTNYQWSRLFFSSQQLYANSVLFYCLTKNS